MKWRILGLSPVIFRLLPSNCNIIALPLADNYVVYESLCLAFKPILPLFPNENTHPHCRCSPCHSTNHGCSHSPIRQTTTRATGAGETLHWFRPEEITESVVEDHGYGNRSYHGERGTGKFRVFIGDMGGRPYSGPLTEALIVAAVAATFPELAGKLVGVSSRA
jgi:hypothetical protein